jgi:hypothetical protein
MPRSKPPWLARLRLRLRGAKADSSPALYRPGVLITTDFSAWYAGSSLFTLLAVLALAGYAFYTSLGGQKVFKGKLLEE